MGGERYVTEALKEKEKEIINAEGNALTRERELFNALVATALDDAAIEASALFARVRAAQMAYEAPLLVSALQAFADGRMRAEPGRILDPDGRDAPPLDLTADVETRRARGE